MVAAGTTKAIPMAGVIKDQMVLVAEIRDQVVASSTRAAAIMEAVSTTAAMVAEATGPTRAEADPETRIICKVIDSIKIRDIRTTIANIKTIWAAVARKAAPR